MKGKLFVLSGPSGVGKGTVRAALLKDYSDIQYSISATTRSRREGETHGIDYFYISRDEFEKMIMADELLEGQNIVVIVMALRVDMLRKN